jgi:hypothetical protein
MGALQFRFAGHNAYHVAAHTAPVSFDTAAAMKCHIRRD